MKFVFAVFTFFLLLHMQTSNALPNPAAVNCSKQGHQYLMLKNTGFCVFDNGSYCEEWAYARQKCDKGQNYFPGGKFDKSKLKNYCVTRTKNKTTIAWCR